METKIIPDPNRATILLGISKPYPPQKVLSYGFENGLVPKPEFHLTVVPLRLGKKILSLEKHDFFKRVEFLAQEYAWDYELLPEFFLLEKHYSKEDLERSGYQDLTPHTRRTIIQMASVPDLPHFYERLTEVLGFSAEIPIAHVTLFSWSDYKPMMTQGIGIYSKEDLKAYRVPKFS